MADTPEAHAWTEAERLLMSERERLRGYLMLTHRAVGALADLHKAAGLYERELGAVILEKNRCTTELRIVNNMLEAICENVGHVMQDDGRDSHHNYTKCWRCEHTERD